MKYNLYAAAKARNCTIDDYIGTHLPPEKRWLRWWHIHQELAFDRAQSMLEEVSMAMMRKKSEKTPSRGER